MRRRILPLGTALVLLAALAPSLAAQSSALQSEEFERFVANVMETWHVPGMAIAVVAGDEIVYSSGFGSRDLEGGQKVDTETQFAIGSSSKAFTTMLLGMLDEEGVIDWDEPVRTWLPDFDLSDNFATERMTPRDLVTHRSGLPRHDLLWYGSSRTREDLYASLAFLEPSTDFRTTFQYQNLMYMTAGILAGRVTGSTWEALVAERIFEPLEMRTSGFTWDKATGTGNAAYGYRWDADAEELVRMPYHTLTAIGPAGSINSNVEEMANWVRLHLALGEFGGERIVAEEQVRDMHAQSMFIPRPDPDAAMPLFGYGLGWFTEPYRGYWRVHHGGNIDGFSALVSMLPDNDIGLVILTNLDGNPATAFIERGILDRMLHLEQIDWSQRALDVRAEAEKEREERTDEEGDEPKRVEGTTPNHALDSYAGNYKHPGYGELRVEREGDGLVARYNLFTFDLEHWHFEQYRATDPNRPGLEFMFNFGTSQEGTVANVAVNLQPGVAPIVFEREES